MRYPVYMGCSVYRAPPVTVDGGGSGCTLLWRQIHLSSPKGHVIVNEEETIAGVSVIIIESSLWRAGGGDENQ